jgi:hypothetical protein
MNVTNPLPKVRRSFSDAGMRRMKKQALAWAKREAKRCQQQNIPATMYGDHILAEVGRHWNVGCLYYVQSELKINFHVQDESEVDELDEEEE